MSNALVSVQIIPKAATTEEVISFVDSAIEIIDQAGVKYEVHALETTMEGDLEHLLKVIVQINEKMIQLGSPNVLSQVKILYQPNGIALETLTEKYRP